MKKLVLTSLLAFCFSLVNAQTLELAVDINQGSGHSYPYNISTFGDKLFFHAYTEEHGYEPYISDGTAEGTYQILDIYPGPTYSMYTSGMKFYSVNGKMVFTARSASEGFELAFSDGTAEGTMVLDLNPGSGDSYPTDFIEFNGKIYFRAYHSSYGYEVWTTDGTPEGTQMLADIYPGSSSSSPSNFHVFDNMLYFRANNPTYGTELYRTDGTTLGTELFKDVEPGSGASSPYSMVSDGSKMFFTAYTSAYGWELYVTDGTVSGTDLVKDVRPGSSSSNTTPLVIIDGILIFYANDGTHGTELWKSDGTSSGTDLLEDIYPGSSSGIYNLGVVVKGAYYYVGITSSEGIELFKATPDGAELVKDIISGSGHSYPTYLFEYNGRLYFLALDNTSNYKMYEYDPSTDMANVIQPDIATQASVSISPPPTYLNGSMYFNGAFNTSGVELWRLSSNFIAGIEDQEINSMNIYPNPGAEFTLDLGQVYDQVKVQVYGMDGVLYHEQEAKLTESVHLAFDQPAGIYFVRVQTPAGFQTFKLIKN